mmetsp:Transcript_38769/g.61408  ORF Transcript_38769/g.61408 Transcript_38769/m.61408 type:complete len:174 (-) Transcript_38769:17-538(-)
MHLPPVIVFDLDGTLWAPEMYEMFGGGGAPFSVVNSGELRGCDGTKVLLIADVPDILQILEDSPSTTVAIASRTDEPRWANECMEKFKTKKGRSILSLIRISEIYKGSKTIHLKEIARKSKCSFGDLVFFDNEMGNVEDARGLGVHAVYCPDGVTKKAWEEGISMWKSSKEDL